jgi:hypothetical protein
VASAYRLTELGWVQFERLCAEVVHLRHGVEPDRWQGRADRLRVVGLPEGPDIPTTGPATAAAWWLSASVQRRLERGSLLESVTAALADEVTAPPRPSGVLLLTNVELAPDEIERIRAELRLELRVLGPGELGELLDGEPRLRRRVPSVLGVRDLAALVPQDLLDRSTGDVAAARALAPVFVPTRPYEHALRVLERHRFAVLTGPPEMGKTAIARMLGLALLTEGRELHECTRPDELWSRLARDRAQVFVADDAFGSTEYRPDAAERWALELDRVLRAMDERHWLVWTSRPAPLRAALARIHREHGVERWPQPAEVHVAAAELDVEEKAQILYRHAKAREATEWETRLVRHYGWGIVSHRHFTPERIRRFVTDRLPELSGRTDLFRPGDLARAIAEEIRMPTVAMATSLHALPAEYRALLVALLDVPPGPVPERELAAAARRHALGLPKPPAELVDRLTDHFVRTVPPLSVTWVHPSWRDLVILDLAADGEQRRMFLSRCSVDGILLALSVGGGREGERVLPLLDDDADWDALAGRVHSLGEELEPNGLGRLLHVLGAALAADLGGRTSAELEAITAELLGVLARRWDAGAQAIPVDLLEALVAARRQLRGDPPPLPEIVPTWEALRPSWARIDVTSPHQLTRVDDWLRLAALVRDVAPGFLEWAGFPTRQWEQLRLLVFDASRLAGAEDPPPTVHLLAACLRRLDDVAPEVAAGAARVAAALTPARPVEWTSVDVDPALPPDTGAAIAIVTRILRDLER